MVASAKLVSTKPGDISVTREPPDYAPKADMVPLIGDGLPSR